MIFFFLFVLGLIVGSFLNVIALRWNSSVSATKGRSFCVVCRKNLSWWELIPVVSFIGLGGKCSECRTNISYQYPLVELLTGFLFVTVPVIAIPVFCIYMVIAIYDLRHKIIPDTLSYAAVILAIIIRLVSGGTWLDWLAGPIMFAFFGLIWLISRGRAAGFGDAKLSLSIGLLLGAAAGFSAFVLAFWIGTGITLLYMFIFSLHTRWFKGGKKLTMKSEIPFAPFLILGAWLALILHLDLFHVFSFFS